MKDDAEELYFEMYTEISDHGEYLQSGSRSTRYSLPDILVVAAVASAFGAFANAFLARLGELASEALSDKVKSLLRRSDGKPAHEATIEAVRLLMPYLEELGSSTDEQRSQEEDWVTDELIRLGFTHETAAVVSRRVLDSLRNWS